MQNQMLFTPKFKELAGNLPLTNYSDVIAVYSLRRMWMNYSGPLIKVFRASDSVEMDIGYGANGLLDTTTLLNFIGTGDGFVSTWYDQSGNNRHLNKVTGGNRPAIVLQGRITMHNKRAGLYFNQVSYGVQTLVTNSFSFTTPFSWYVVSNLITKNTAFMDGGFGHCMSVRSLGGATTDIRLDGSTTGGSLRTSNMLIWAKSAITWFYSNPLGSFCKLFANNVLIQQKDTIGPITSPGLCMGGVYDRYVDAGNEFYIHEFVLFNTSDETKRINLTSEVNSHYQLFWDGSKQGLLDKYPNSVAAYSLRALRSGYTGPVVAIRRSNGGEVMNFYANYDGDLDVKAIREFCGTGDGFISTWYDQSGSGRHLTQTDTSKQPHIVIAGEVQLENGKPAVRFGKNGVTFLSTSTNYLNAQSFSFLRVMNNYGNGNFDVLSRNSGTTYVRGDHIFGLSGNIYAPFWTIVSGVQEYIPNPNNNTASLNQGQRIILASREANSSTKSYRIQNNELIQYEGTSIDTTWITHNSPFILGTFHLTSSEYLNGTTQEWIYWSVSNFSNLDEVIREVNTYYSSFPNLPVYDKQDYSIAEMEQFRKYLLDNFNYSFNQWWINRVNPGLLSYEHLSGVFADNDCIYLPPFHGTKVGKYDVINNTYTPIISNIGTYGDPKYGSAVFYPQRNKVYFIPISGSWPIKELDVTSETTVDIDRSFISGGFWGGVLASNNMIYFIPSTANRVVKLDPETNIAVAIGDTLTSLGYAGGVLATNGKIYCVPHTSRRVLEIDPFNDTTTLIGSENTAIQKWSTGVLAPNGKIYCIPYKATKILEIDPVSKSTNLVGNNVPTSSAEAYSAGALGPDGNIYAVPHTTNYCLKFNPNNYQLTEVYPSAGAGNGKWWGLNLHKNGSMYGIPYQTGKPFIAITSNINQSNSPSLSGLSKHVHLSRHINKF